MRAFSVLLILGLTIFLSAAPASSHHGFDATFDANKPLVLRGVVTKVELMNPHSWFWVDVKNADGTVVNWGFEGGSPNSLIRRGITKNTLPVGTEIIVNGFQAKSGENKGVAATMTFTDGRKLFMGGSAPGAEPESPEPPKSAKPPRSGILLARPIYC
ncbi:MAG TPA: DUF6152 family protein [Bryobacteraceae bacterium]|nr:DUF6152 family protein [Bryobacteraceae bacterium]